MQISRNSTMDK